MSADNAPTHETGARSRPSPPRSSQEPTEADSAPPAPRSEPPPAPDARASAAQTANEEDPWRKEYHLNKKTFDDNQLQFKGMGHATKCKFSERPKYDIQVKKPNDFDLDWVYSVPCGQKDKKEGPCQSWIFLCVPEDICWNGAKKTKWVADYLESQDWVVVSNDANQRYVCPKCAKEEA